MGIAISTFRPHGNMKINYVSVVTACVSISFIN